MSTHRARSVRLALLACLLVPGAVSAQPAPPALDHFTVYDAAGQLDPPFAIFQDQLALEPHDLGPTRLLLVPARKNAEPLLDPFSHLTCYELTDGVPPPGIPQVTAIHQFGSTDLQLGPARFACIPTEKFPQVPPQPITIDHFICYAATGLAPGAGATFIDQFYGSTHNVLTPFLFCAPATKTLPQQGVELPIQDPLSHLAASTSSRRARRRRFPAAWFRSATSSATMSSASTTGERSACPP
jgi:hypothetical protein